MNPLIIILGIILLNLAAFSLLKKHRRNVRHHRSSTPVIGKHRLLTEVLHKRLLNSPPNADWLSPSVMRSKIVAWLRSQPQSRNTDTTP